ncbi:hypothetical protein [Streptomyces sp. NPDC057910]|uniref:hypothetical protein n=1 Tax=Streptomyces sp. NPDC057910 TaxID=3346278 RepID=UPI0036E50FC9
MKSEPHEGGAMTRRIKSPEPVSTEQLLAALAALGGGVIADPEHQAERPRSSDATELLGAVLVMVELDVASRVDTLAESLAGLEELHRGWGQAEEAAGPGALRALLLNRLQRSGFDIQAFVHPDHGVDDDPAQPAAAAAASAAFAAAGFLAVLDCLEDGGLQAAYGALDAAEGFLAHALVGLHVARQSLSGPDLDEPLGPPSGR